MGEINSKEEAIRVIQEKLLKFATEVKNIQNAVGDEASQLLRALKANGLNTADPAARAKMLAQMKNVLGVPKSLDFWTYVPFVACVTVLLMLFVFMGYYKIYKPLAEKEQLKTEKRLARQNKKTK